MVRIRLAQVRQPEPVGLAQLDHLGHHGEEGEQQRELHQGRDAAAEHAHAVLLLQVHDLGVHLRHLRISGLGVLVLCLDRVDLRLNPLHFDHALHALQAQRHEKDVDEDREDDDRPSPRVVAWSRVRRSDPRVHRLQTDEEILRNRSPEAEVEQRFQRVAVDRLHTLQQLQVFRSDEDPRLRVAGEITDCCSQHRKLNILACRLAFGAEQVVHVELVVQRHEVRALRVVRQNGRREVLVAHSAEVEWPVQRCSAGNLLRSNVLVLAVLHRVDRRIRRIRVPLSCARDGEIAHPRRPGEQRPHRGAVFQHLRIGVNKVVLTEGEGLGDIEPVSCIVERQRRGRGERPSRRRNIHRVRQRLG